MARPAYERVGAAFRAAYQAAGLRQEDIANALDVDQGTVSRWARGLQKLDLDYFPLIDELCGQPKGHLLRLADYVDDDPRDVRAAIMAEPRLDESTKLTLIDLYESALRRVERERLRQGSVDRRRGRIKKKIESDEVRKPKRRRSAS